MHEIQTLHIVNKAPDHPRFRRCLAMLAPGDTLLLIEDARTGHRPEGAGRGCALPRTRPGPPGSGTGGQHGPTHRNHGLCRHGGTDRQSPARNQLVTMDNATLPTRNNEGFLENAWEWTPEVAQALAAEAHIDLTENHWEIINFLRDFYKEHEVSPPSNRLFVKAVKERFGETKGNSIYLMQLFPGTPAKTACRIAGLPRPTNCL